MNDIELMKLAFDNYVKLRELSISKRQNELIQYLEGHKATSSIIAIRHDLSVQNASQQLKNLFMKGYLIREEVADKTGGYIFEYTSNPALFEWGDKTTQAAS